MTTKNSTALKLVSNSAFASVTVKHTVLRTVLEGAIVHASNDETRARMNGINIAVDGERLTIQATDGHRGYECRVCDGKYGAEMTADALVRLADAKRLVAALKAAGKPRKGQTALDIKIERGNGPDLFVTCPEIGLSMAIECEPETFPALHRVMPKVPRGLEDGKIGINAGYLADACNLFTEGCVLSTHGSALDPITVSGEIAEGITARVVIMPMRL